MADNQTLYPGDTGTAFTAAADEIASVKYPRVKITWGVDGTATDASATNPLPTTPAGNVAHDAADSGNPVKVGGKYNATPAAITDGDRADLQTDNRGSLRTVLMSNNSSNPLGATAITADDQSAATALLVASYPLMFDGSTWDRFRGTSTDGLLVNLGANNDVTFGGTVTCDTELPAAAALADNTANPTTTSVGSLGMVYDGTTWDRQLGNSTDGTLVNLGANNDVTVTSGSVTVSGSVTADTELPAAVALADNTATPTVPAVGAFGMVWDGATWDRAKGDSTDGTLVNLGTNNDVTVTSGTVTIGTSVTPGTAATNLGKAEDAAHTTGDVGVMSLGVRNDSLAALTTTDGDYSPISTDSLGRVFINGGSGATSLGKAEDAAHTSGDVGVQMLAVRNDAGATLTTTDLDYSPVSVNSSGQLHIGFLAPGNAAASIGKQEDQAHVSGDTGVMSLGVRADTPTAYAGADDYHPILTSGRGSQWTTQIPSTLGGLSINRVISAATTNATSVKASAGQVYGWYITNVNAAARYVKFYNKASAPTVGSDTPVMTLAIPANGGTNVEFTNGVAFATGIALAITTGATDADTGAVAANEIIVNTLYS